MRLHTSKSAWLNGCSRFSLRGAELEEVVAAAEGLLGDCRCGDPGGVRDAER